MRNVFILTGSIFALVLTSCSSGEAEESHSVSETWQAPTENTLENRDSVKMPETIAEPHNWVSIDTVLQAKILMTGSFHGDEIESNIEQKDWIALIANTEGAYELKDVGLIVKRENDPIIDEEDEETGWNIGVEKADDPLVLLSGPFTEGPVKFADLPKNQLLPGDTVRFTFQESEYMIFATGAYEEYSEDWFAFTSYKLFITGEKQGEKITQLIVGHENFDDAMVTIWFVGDIDRDGLPDLLMENTRHYNVSNPVLYLSGKAGQGKLLRIEGWLWTTGC